VDAIGALEAQINQLHDFAEVLRQQLEATRVDCDRWRQRAQRLMRELCTIGIAVVEKTDRIEKESLET
jgi:hypothetical protein